MVSRGAGQGEHTRGLDRSSSSAEHRPWLHLIIVINNINALFVDLPNANANGTGTRGVSFKFHLCSVLHGGDPSVDALCDELRLDAWLNSGGEAALGRL